MGQRARYLVWTVRVFFSLCIECHCQLVDCCLLSQKCWTLSIPGVVQHREEGMVTCPWAFAVGTWWCSSWRAVLVSIHCWRRWGLWRDAWRHHVYSELDQGRSPSLSSRLFPKDRYVPRPETKHDLHDLWLKCRQNFPQSALCSFSLLLYEISYTTAKKNYYRCCWKPLF